MINFLFFFNFWETLHNKDKSSRIPSNVAHLKKVVVSIDPMEIKRSNLAHTSFFDNDQTVISPTFVMGKVREYKSRKEKEKVCELFNFIVHRAQRFSKKGRKKMAESFSFSLGWVLLQNLQEDLCNLGSRHLSSGHYKYF